MKLRKDQDAFGRALYDAHHGVDAHEVVERDDGFLDVASARDYLALCASWSAATRRVLGEVRGRVLDLGCGAGRFAIPLQERGHEVLGIDVSPLAIRTARLRGLAHARILSITEVSARLGTFDTVLMLGNNFGLVANPKRARWLLRRLRSLTRADARIIAQSLDIYRTDDPVHLRYQRANRRRGRMSGQIRMRIRYRDLATPYYDYLLVSRSEMAEIVEGTGWEMRRCWSTAGPSYVAVLERTTYA
jgi:SAM-dependent methyltransferase